MSENGRASQGTGSALFAQEEDGQAEEEAGRRQGRQGARDDPEEDPPPQPVVGGAEASEGLKSESGAKGMAEVEARRARPRPRRAPGASSGVGSGAVRM